MTLDEFEQTYARPVIFAACLYESAAIGSRRLPTITEWVKRLYRTPAGQAVLWLVWGWLTAHFFRAVVQEES